MKTNHDLWLDLSLLLVADAKQKPHEVTTECKGWCIEEIQGIGIYNPVLPQSVAGIYFLDPTEWPLTIDPWDLKISDQAERYIILGEDEELKDE